MRQISYHKSFKKDYERLLKRGCNMEKLERVLELLVDDQPLPSTYCDHVLQGQYHGLRECHISPDWLLIYFLSDDQLTLVLSRMGSHSDLF